MQYLLVGEDERVAEYLEARMRALASVPPLFPNGPNPRFIRRECATVGISTWWAVDVLKQEIDRDPALKNRIAFFRV